MMQLKLDNLPECLGNKDLTLVSQNGMKVECHRILFYLHNPLIRKILETIYLDEYFIVLSEVDNEGLETLVDEVYKHVFFEDNNERTTNALF